MIEYFLYKNWDRLTPTHRNTLIFLDGSIAVMFFLVLIL